MACTARSNLLAAAISLVTLGAGGATAGASNAGNAPAVAPTVTPAITPAEPVEFTTVAAIDASGPTGLALNTAIRVADPDDLARLERIVHEAPSDPAHPSDPDEPSPGQLVLDAIADAFADSIPADSVLLVGLVAGCSPQPGVIRLADGEVALVDSGSDPNVLCTVAHTIVAVVEVAAADVPVGSADRATLQQFEFVGNEPTVAVTEFELRPVADGDRRITTIVSGCRDTTAELVVSASAVEAVAKSEHGEPDHDCAQAEFFVVTFDIAAGLIPDTAEVPSTSGR